ncbi:MAG: hypothetical protein IJZ48_05170 [Oscillospiraceae bacterium]|nr:hypothetical protein [Oscillospiraceae bacterium]
MKKHLLLQVLFQLNPPLRVGEILLRNVKFSLRSSEIAAAVGGFNFTLCASRKFHFDEVEISHSAQPNISLKIILRYQICNKLFLIKPLFCIAIAF